MLPLPSLTTAANNPLRCNSSSKGCVFPSQPFAFCTIFLFLIFLPYSFRVRPFLKLKAFSHIFRLLNSLLRTAYSFRVRRTTFEYAIQIINHHPVCPANLFASQTRNTDDSNLFVYKLYKTYNLYKDIFSTFLVCRTNRKLLTTNHRTPTTIYFASQSTLHRKPLLTKTEDIVDICLFLKVHTD